MKKGSLGALFVCLFVCLCFYRLSVFFSLFSYSLTALSAAI